MSLLRQLLTGERPRANAASNVTDSFFRVGMGEPIEDHVSNEQLTNFYREAWSGGGRSIQGRGNPILEGLDYVFQHTPLLGSVASIWDENTVNSARARIDSGEGTDDDYIVMARFLNNQQADQNRSFGESVQQTVFGDAPSAVLSYATGARAAGAVVGASRAGLAGGIMQAARGGTAAAAQGGRLGSLAQGAGVEAIRLLLTPDFFLKEAAQRGMNTGTPTYYAQNLGPAIVSGYFQNAIFGSMGQIANNVAGTGIRSILKRNVARVFVGLGEQEVSEAALNVLSTVVPEAYKMRTDWGPVTRFFRNAARGESIWEPLADVTSSAITFAAFAAMHEGQQFRGRQFNEARQQVRGGTHGPLHTEQLAKFRDSVNEAKRQGLNPTQTANLIDAVHKGFLSFIRKNPLATRAETSRHMREGLGTLRGTMRFTALYEYADRLADMRPESFPEGMLPRVPGPTAEQGLSPERSQWNVQDRWRDAPMYEGQAPEATAFVPENLPPRVEPTSTKAERLARLQEYALSNDLPAEHIYNYAKSLGLDINDPQVKAMARGRGPLQVAEGDVTPGWEQVGEDLYKVNAKNGFVVSARLENGFANFVFSDRANRSNQTGELGTKAVGVMKEIGRIVDEFITQHKPAVITFEGSNVRGRNKLYARMFNELIKRPEYQGVIDAGRESSRTYIVYTQEGAEKLGGAPWDSSGPSTPKTPSRPPVPGPTGELGRPAFLGRPTQPPEPPKTAPKATSDPKPSKPATVAPDVKPEAIEEKIHQWNRLTSEEIARGEGEVYRVSPEEARAAVEKAKEGLTEREREIVSRDPGLDEKATLQRLATKHGVTRERIRQIEKSALLKMAGSLGVEVDTIKSLDKILRQSVKGGLADKGISVKELPKESTATGRRVLSGMQHKKGKDTKDPLAQARRDFVDEAEGLLPAIERKDITKAKVKEVIQTALKGGLIARNVALDVFPLIEAASKTGADPGKMLAETLPDVAKSLGGRLNELSQTYKELFNELERLGIDPADFRKSFTVEASVPGQKVAGSRGQDFADKPGVPAEPEYQAAINRLTEKLVADAQRMGLC